MRTTGLGNDRRKNLVPGFGGENMRFRPLALFVMTLVLGGMARAQSQSDVSGATSGTHRISVASQGVVHAKPDTAVVFLEVRSTSPLAVDALEENNAKVQKIKTKLTDLGVPQKQVEFSANQFAPAGGGRYYMPGGQRPTGFDVFSLLKIRLPTTDEPLDDLSVKITRILDELSKEGASMVSQDISRISLGGSSVVVFTVSESAGYEAEAYQKAIASSRPVAEKIAQKLGHRLKGIEGIYTSASANQMIRPGMSNWLGLNYYSTSPDEVQISRMVTIIYSFE